MVLNGVDSVQFSEIAPQGAKTATGAKGLNRHFGAETALLNLQCMNKGSLHSDVLLCSSDLK